MRNLSFNNFFFGKLFGAIETFEATNDHELVFEFQTRKEAEMVS
jgi:hypothetical protein